MFHKERTHFQVIETKDYRELFELIHGTIWPHCQALRYKSHVLQNDSSNDWAPTQHFSVYKLLADDSAVLTELISTSDFLPVDVRLHQLRFLSHSSRNWIQPEQFQLDPSDDHEPCIYCS